MYQWQNFDAQHTEVFKSPLPPVLGLQMFIDPSIELAQLSQSWTSSGVKILYFTI